MTSFGRCGLALLVLGHLLYLPHNKVVGGVYWFHSVRPSVRPSHVRPASHVRSIAPTILVESISYLHILSSNFRRFVACQVSCKMSKFDFWQFFKICNFDVLFWLGIWCESLVWVITGRRGVSQNVGVLVVLVLTNPKSDDFGPWRSSLHPTRD